MKISILDSGYVEAVDHWGSEEGIIEAARMSTGKGFLGWGLKCRECGDLWTAPERLCPLPTGREYIDSGRGGHVFDVLGDEKLLRYLWMNKHATPFEMAGLTLEVQAPIFVLREWVRHRSMSYSELSSRYSPLPDVNYLPSMERLMRNAGEGNKQAGTIQGAETLNEEVASEWRGDLEYLYKLAERVYQDGLKKGVPKELARLAMPVGRYSRMRVSANLRNWLGFLTLRLAPNAQEEIRLYAATVEEIVKGRFPRTWELFQESEGRG